LGGVFTKLIEANTTIPSRKSEVFSTAVDNQPSVQISVFQGERAMARDNRKIGEFILDGIPPASRGVPQVEVAFDLDANGILSVSAKDKGTGKEHSIRIEASTGLSKEEVERMKNEAKANEAADKEAKEKIEKLNQADSMIFQTEKQLEEFGDKLSAPNKTAIEGALAELKTAHQAQDLAGIESATATLNGAWQAASQEIYQAQQEAQAGGEGQQNPNQGTPNNDADSDDVQDVEYEEVDERKA